MFEKRIGEYHKDRAHGLYFEYEGKTYELDLTYQLGGMNYFTGNTEPRGIFLGVTPVKLSLDGMGKVTWKSFTAFSGIKVLMQPAKRHNAKALEVMASDLFSNPEISETANRLLLAVIEKNGGK